MSEHTPTPWRVAREVECPDPWVIAVGEGDSIGEFSPPGPWLSETTCIANARRAVACVNAFHDPAGRKIATEDIGEGVVFQLRDALNQMQNWACKFESMLEYESLKDEKQFGKEHGEARALLSSLKIQEPDS